MRKITSYLLAFVCLPTILVAIYSGFFASNQWVSEAKFTIRGAQASTQPDLLGFILGGNGTVAADSLLLHDYILSKDMVDILEQKIKIREQFSNKSIDFVSRLSEQATKDELIVYVGNHISVVFENSSGVSTLKVRAYKPEDANAIANVILQQSEILVNRLSERAQADAVELAQNELVQAEQKVLVARAATKAFRDERGAIDPKATAASILNLVATLDGNLAQANAELSEARTYMNEKSAKVVALKAKANAIREQITAAKSRLTGKHENVVSNLVEGYQRVSADEEFAEKRYAAALSAYEAARVQAMTKSRYLVPVSNPSLPEKPDWIRRIMAIVKVFGGCLLAFVLVSMTIAAIREHSRQ